MRFKVTILTLCLTLAMLVPLLFHPAPAAAQTACDGVSYTVKTGDNLYQISLAYGVSMDSIAAANGIVNYNLVYIGQTLCIPNAGAGGYFGTGGPTTTADGAAFSTTGITVPEVGYPATATVYYDAPNHTITVTAGDLIPNSQVRFYVSGELGDRSGGAVHYGMTDSAGNINETLYLPWMDYHTRQYVMVRAYDGRMRWGYFDKVQSFP